MSEWRPRIRIRIVFSAACTVDAAWDALHDPTVASELYAPLLQMRPERPLPARFASGEEVRVAIRLFGALPSGAQLIRIEDESPSRGCAGARTMRDTGRPLAGPLALLAGWNHEITVRPSREGTAWHDELTILGWFAPLFFPVLAAMWRWRRFKLLQLAQTWTGGA